MTAESRHPVCPDAEQLAAFADGGLSAGDRHMIETHLAECDDCYEALVEIAAVTAQIAAPMPEAVSRLSTHLRARKAIWWISGTLAAAASVIVLINVWNGSRPDALELAKSALAQAERTSRLGMGRLSVDWKWAPELSVLRSGTAGGDAPDALNVKGPAHALKMLAAQDHSARGLHSLGLALVASREYDAAIDALDQAVRQSAPNDAVIHSDLSAVLLERHKFSGRKADAERALSEADRALAIAPQHLSATFNRALALDALDLPEARQAWQTYIDLDRDPAAEWRDEATRRRDEAARRRDRQR